ncbi:TldD/PmbA family protein [Thermogladius sp. 4427co]|uniref:TldD/PmbA family protein n=1 Tax=Thermogladius sp. 4427co TaxID=3450718 RepID=UPI003F7ABBF7
MNLRELASSLVNQALSTGLDEAAVLINDVRRVMVKFANSQPSVLQDWKIVESSFYLSKDRRIIVGSLSTENPEQLKKVFEESYKSAAKILESELYAPLPEPTAGAETISLSDPRILESMDNPSQLVETLLEASKREYNIDFIAGKIDLWHRKKILATSKSPQPLEEESTGIEVYVRAFKEDGSGQWGYASRQLDLKKVEETAIRASQLAFESRGRSSVEPGVYDVILSPLVFSQLMNLAGYMSTGMAILTGMSIFADKKVGDKVASPLLSIYDTPRDSKLPFSTSFDDEGLKTYDKPIIENGVLKNIIHNSKTARKFNTVSTGNAGWIYPRLWNLSIAGGDMSLEEMVSEVKRGLLITNNWYTRLQNYVEGIFSTIGRDAIFLIESGRIVKPVEKIRIADKLPKLLNNIEGLSKETFDIMWWEVRIPTRAPYALVRNINISKHLL